MRGNIATYRGNPPQPMPRAPGAPLPCGECAKVAGRFTPKTPDAGRQRDLSPKNRLMLDAYYEWRASRQPVTDPILIRCFGIIERTIERDAQRRHSESIAVQSELAAGLALATGLRRR